MRWWLDAWRFALGTLTVLPVRPPDQVSRELARRAMTLAPVVAIPLAAPSALLISVAEGAFAPLLTAALVIALLAVSTRALHLDGVADTADGLGSGRPAAEALAIMRQGDLGPFGAVTLILLALVQVTALAQAIFLGRGVGVLTVALALSRLALPAACHIGIPPARPDGLGRAVAESMRTRDVVVAALVPIALTVCAVGWLDVPLAPTVAAYLACGLVVAVALRQARRRLGGVTGDVLGAVAELTFTAALVALAVP